MLSVKELQSKFYHSKDHPYHIYENTIRKMLKEDSRIMDAGCGRTMPVLKKFKSHSRACIGVDLEDCTEPNSGIIYLRSDISKINLENNSIDVVISRAVLEHVREPIKVYREINRILKPRGKFIFLVPNIGDYVSIFSLLIPNKYHGIVVSKTEGRKVEDVFPTYYKSNSFRTIAKLCNESNFDITEFKYLGQYPSSFMFNPYLFLVATVYEKIINHFAKLDFLKAWILVVLEKRS